METPPPEISYAAGQVPWYSRPRFHRWIVAITIVLVLAWAVIRYGIPIWQRYQYYRLQQREIGYTNPANVAVVHFSSTQPYAHIPGPVDQFYDSFWTARPKVGLGRRTMHFVPNSPATPIFCGSLKTPAGQTRLVQIYATPGKINWCRFSIQLYILSAELENSHWVLTGTRLPGLQILSDADIQIALNPPGDVTVFTGSANPTDPSEVDVNLVINGHPQTFKFHIADARPGEYNDRFDVDFDRRWFQTHERGWTTGNMWQVPHESYERVTGVPPPPSSTDRTAKPP